MFLLCSCHNKDKTWHSIFAKYDCHKQGRYQCHLFLKYIFKSALETLKFLSF